jgi:hypothetical protein
MSGVCTLAAALAGVADLALRKVIASGPGMIMCMRSASCSIRPGAESAATSARRTWLRL